MHPAITRLQIVFGSNGVKYLLWPKLSWSSLVDYANPVSGATFCGRDGRECRRQARDWLPDHVLMVTSDCCIANMVIEQVRGRGLVKEEWVVLAYLTVMTVAIPRSTVA